MDPDSEPVRIPIADVFDLHSVPPRDVQGVVEEYLIEAHAAGFRAIRIIHGRGIGVQREMVRAVLRRTAWLRAAVCRTSGVIGVGCTGAGVGAAAATGALTGGAAVSALETSR